MYLRQTDNVGFAFHLCTALSPVGDANFSTVNQLPSWSFINCVVFVMLSSVEKSKAYVSLGSCGKVAKTQTQGSCRN